VIACVNNFELFTVRRVLLSICYLSSMKAVTVDFNIQNYVILLWIYINLY